MEMARKPRTSLRNQKQSRKRPGAIVAAQGELVEELAHREAELLTGADAPGDAGEGGVEPCRGMGGEPLGRPPPQ